MTITQRAELYTAERYITVGHLRDFLESVVGYPGDAKVSVGDRRTDGENQETHPVDLLIFETKGEL